MNRESSNLLHRGKNVVFYIAKKVLSFSDLKVLSLRVWLRNQSVASQSECGIAIEKTQIKFDQLSNSVATQQR